MSITIKDIAQIVGVSTGTVDRALNNRGRIKPEVAERIRKVAEELDYKPNKFAKSLSNKRKRLKIVFVQHVATNPFIEMIRSGVQKAADEYKAVGISLIIKACKDFDAETQLALLHEAIEEDKADGIILIPIDDLEISQYVSALHSQGIPVVLLTSFIESDNYFAYVGCNYQYSGQIASGLIDIMMEGQGDLLVFAPNQCMKGNQLRLASMKDYLKTNCPGITISGVIELPADDISSYIQCKEVFAKKPEVKCVIYASGAGSGGLRAILEEQARKPFKLLTYDLSDLVKQGLLSGNITFSLFQNPQEQGHSSMVLLSEYLLLGKMPHMQDNFINTSILIKESLKDVENHILSFEASERQNF